jgi:hypothetical protein
MFKTPSHRGISRSNLQSRWCVERLECNCIAVGLAVAFPRKHIIGFPRFQPIQLECVTFTYEDALYSRSRADFVSKM